MMDDSRPRSPAPLAGTVGARACPSCRAPMHELRLDGHHGQTVVLDLCFSCHGIWFDAQESLQLSARGVLALFETLHAHRNQPHASLKSRLACPVCRLALVRGNDRTISGSFVVHRCPQQHGRFGTFSSFMVEKGFVRHLSRVEISRLAEKLRVIHCSSCGAPVDLRQDHACPYCRSAFSLLDPQAVEKALARYHASVQQNTAAALAGESIDPMAQANRVMAVREVEYLHEKDQLQRKIERVRQRSHWGTTVLYEDALWEMGLAALWRLIRGLLH